MARSSTSWKPGIKSPNPTGKMTLGERVAARTIAESFRELADPADIGRALLAIFSGVDPFAKSDKANPDGLPVPGPVPIDMTHRMAALKMFLEYGYGKPLQGVVIDAQVRQETRVVEERTTVVELRTIAARDPNAREALRTIARAMLGAPASSAPPATSSALTRRAPELSSERAELEVIDVPSPDAVELDDAVEDEPLPIVDDELRRLADATAAELEEPEKKRVRLPGDVL